MQTLEVKDRAATDVPAELRAQGRIPAVMYGKGQESTSVSIDTRAFEKAFKTAGFSSVISLSGDGDGKDALVYDVAYHPVTGTPIHADLYLVAKGQTVEIEIPLVFEGIAPAEKAGAVIVRVMHSIEVKAEPRNLPHELVIDLAALAAEGDRITAGDIKLPTGVTLVTDGEEVIVSATAFKEEKEEVAAPVEGAAEAAPAAEEKKDE